LIDPFFDWVLQRPASVTLSHRLGKKFQFHDEARKLWIVVSLIQLFFLMDSFLNATPNPIDS
jgi:hypothetical protein